MKVMNAHITWNSLPTSCEFLASSAEVFIDGLGIFEIRDFISEETRKKLYDEIIEATRCKIKLAVQDMRDI